MTEPNREREDLFRDALLLVLLAVLVWEAVGALGREWTPLFWALVVVGATFLVRIRWARPVAYVVGALAVVWFFSTIWRLLFPFLAAFVIAYLVSPIVSALERRGIPRGVSALALILVALAAVAGLLFLVVPPIVHQLTGLVHALGSLSRQLELWVVGANERLAALDDYEISPYAQPAVNSLIARAQGVFAALFEKVLKFVTSLSALVTHVVNIIITPIITFYLLRDMPKIRRWVREHLPQRYLAEATEIFEESDRVLAGWIRGQFILSSLEGAFIAGGLTLIGLPYALLLGIFAGFANMVPYVGTYVGAAPAAVVALLGEDPTRHVLLTVGFFVFVNLFDAYVLAPRIVGRRVGLHPVITMVAMLVGAKFFGVVGFLGAVPVTGILKVVGRRLERRYVAGPYFNEAPPAEVAGRGTDRSKKARAKPRR